MSKQINVILSGGGTGGHIYPALAIANEIKARYKTANILFVGANGKMEMEKVPQSGYDIKGLNITGIQRKLTFSNLIFPFKLVVSLIKAYRIIRKFKPDVAIGTGGFASGPTLLVANWMNIPSLVQEQNSYPGITNKLLSKRSEKICVAYDNLERFFSKDKIIKTGNPVRQDLLTVSDKTEEAIKFFKLDKSKKTLLVIGGSLGARRINQLIASHVEFFKQKDVQVIWQCGKLYLNDYQKYNDGENVFVKAFLNKMDFAYAAADFVISRAGASSVSELCLVGKPTIFIPSPNVSEDHQTKNAIAVANQEGAIVIKEKNLDCFQSEFESLIKDKEKQLCLSVNIKKLALPNATKHIVEEIDKLLK